MKILITGSTGVVGKNLMPYLTQTKYEVLPFGFGNCVQGIQRLDLTDFNLTETIFRKVKPKIVLHLAGIKDVIYCEKERDFSHLLNFKVTENVANICKGINAKLVCVSSDYVFDGINGPFSEDTHGSPTTQYGLDNWMSEKFIQSNLDQYAIVRSSGIFGYHNDFVDLVRKNLKKGYTFIAYDNLFNNPTFIGDFWKMIDIIICNDFNGLFHCSGTETVNRYSFAQYIAESFNLKKELIIPKSLDFSSDVRPPRLELNNQKTYDTLNYFPAPIKESIKKHKGAIWSQ